MPMITKVFTRNVKATPATCGRCNWSLTMWTRKFSTARVTTPARRTFAALNAKRSYIFNGFNDYFKGSYSGKSMPESEVKQTSETILFGEKDANSGHWWMDYWQLDDI